MSITIGDAIIWLRGDDKKLDGDLQGAETKTKGVLARISSSFKESMNFAVGQVMAQGLDMLSRGIENTTKEVIELGQTYAQQVEDMSRLSGATVEDASRIIQVADDMRLSYSGVSTALKMYARQAAESGEAADMSIETLARLSDQYLSLAPGVERTNFLLENFGRSGAEMGKLMEQGGDGIRSMAAAVDDSLVMTQEGIDAAEEYRLAMDEWGDATMGVKLELAQALLPVLKDMVVIAKESLIPALKALIDGFVSLPEPARVTIIAIGALIVALVKLGPLLLAIAGLASMLGGGGAAAGAAGAAAGGGGILAGLGAALAAVSAPVWLLVAAIAALIAVVVLFGKDAINTVAMIGKIWMAAWQRMWYEVNAFGQKLSGWVKTLAANVRTWFGSVGKGIVEGIRKGISDGWEGLKTWISSNLNSLLDWVKAKLGISSPSLVFAAQVGAPMAQGIGMGFEEALKSQVQATINASVNGMAASSGAAMQNVNVGTLVVDSRLSQRERDYWDERSARISERSTLKWLRKGSIA